MENYTTYRCKTSDGLLQFSNFYKYIFIYEDVETPLGGADSNINEANVCKLDTNILSDKEKMLVYYDCKNEVISIREFLKKQTYLFSDKKFSSIKKKYKDILRLMRDLEPFVFEDDILERLNLANSFEDLFNEIDKRQIDNTENNTAKSFVEQLDGLEKELNIGKNFKNDFTPSTTKNKVATETTRFIIGLKFVDGSIYEYINSSNETGKVRAREIFKDELNKLPEGKGKENKTKLYANYIDDTLNYLYEVKNKDDKLHFRNFEKNLFINNTDKINVEEIWNAIVHHCRNNRIPIDESFKKDFKEKYKYSLV